MATDPKVTNQETPSEYDHRNLGDDTVLEPAAVAPVEPVAAPEPAKSKHPEALVLRAKELGADDAYIDSLTTNQLAHAIYLTERRERELLREQQVANALQRQPAPEPPPAPAVVDDDVIDAETASAIDPKILKRLDRVKSLEKELEEIKGHVKAGAERERAREQKTVFDRIDDAFASMGEKYAKLFGEGTHEELASGNPSALRRRAAVVREAGFTKDIPAPKVLLQKLRAIADDLFMPAESAAPQDPNAYGEGVIPKGKQPAKPKGGARPTQEEWDEAALVQPTSRQSPVDKVKGDKAAMQAVHDWQKRNGRANEDDLENPAVQLNGVPE